MVDNEGSLYVVSRAPLDQPDMIDTVFKFQNGRWTTVNPLPESYYDQNGNLVTTGRLNPRTDNLAQDGEGNLLFKAPNSSLADSTFKIDSQGNVSVLPPIRREDVDVQGRVRPGTGYWDMQTDLYGSGGRGTGQLEYDPAATF
jgi:hypothetical protein